MNTNIIEVPAQEENGVSDLPRLAERIFAEHEAFHVVKAPEAPPAGNDFTRFYGLRENPFSDAVNPGYFYKTQSHADALGKMTLAVEHNTSLGMITGPSGTGKTLVTQLLLQQFDSAKHHAVLVLDPGILKLHLSDHRRRVLGKFSERLQVLRERWAAPEARECRNCGLVLGSADILLDRTCQRCGTVVGLPVARCPNCSVTLPAF